MVGSMSWIEAGTFIAFVSASAIFLIFRDLDAGLDFVDFGFIPLHALGLVEPIP